MPLISPRRSSTTASGSIYGTSSSSATGGSTASSDSSSSRSAVDRIGSGYKSYLDRASSLSKISTSSSSYSPNLSSYLGTSSYSSYSPRSSSTYRSAGSSLSGGSSGVGTYRSILSSLGTGSSGNSNYDTTTLGRYGKVKTRGKVSDVLKKECNGHDSAAASRKPPSGSDGSGSGNRESKRMSGSCSSSSLARLVATSGLDLYEKYSPTYYKPNTELSGSRSGLNETGTDLDERGRTMASDITTANNEVTLDRPRSRYSHLYSRNDTDETDNVSSSKRSISGAKSFGSLSASNSATALNCSASTDDVPTATFTLRNNRLRKAKATDEDSRKIIRNGTSDSDSKSQLLERQHATSNGVDAEAHINLNKLQISQPHNKHTNDKLNSRAFLDDKKDDLAKADNTEMDNYEKQKCDPDIVLKTQQTNTNTPTISNASIKASAAALKRKPAAAVTAQVKSQYSSKAATVVKSPSNPVRDANQHFFLISAYKDQNFLKAECEFAHDQVLKPLQKDKLPKKPTLLPAVIDHRRTVNSCNKVFTSNHNPPRTPAALAATSNGMRRTGNGTHLGTTTAVAPTINKVELNYTGPQFKGLPSGSTSVASASSSASKKLTSTYTKANSTTYTSTKLNIRNQIKPLVHRSTAGPASLVTYSSASSQGSSKNNNNNGSNSSLNSITNSGNNNMQTSLDQDDIKFIDSDDPQTATMATERKSQALCEQRFCLNPLHHSGGVSSKSRIRPKSTIICSTSHTATSHNPGTANCMIFEKVNNYKYSNGSMGGGVVGAALPASTSDRRTETAIDSNSIRASIEKFNSFSEQKRLPLSSVTLRSHSGSGSTSNLQHHRHSSDLDNCNLRLQNSGGGSLTRSPYRSSGSTAGKVITSLYPSASAAVSSISSRQILSSNPSSTGSLPLNKSSKHYAQAEDTTFSGLSSSVDGDVSKKKLTSISGGLSETTDERVRSSAPLRSALPPASPTASRYWDRDSSRSSLISSSTSHNNTDENKKSSSNDEETEGLCGLRNIGNTCFMNSVIQCLSHTNELKKYLRNYSATKSPTSKDQQILYEFSKLIKEMWTNNVNSVTPMELKRAFSAKHRMYSDYNQQDAQEFLRFFLDSLHGALNSGAKGEHLKIDDNLSDNKKAELTWDWYGRHENSLIRDLFVGQLKSTLRCTICGNASVTFDPFWDLSVPLPSSSRCKLDACLDLFIREEVLDGDEMPTCSKCQIRRKCTKSFTIQRFPKYLVIHLKRFSETRWSKMSNIVEFPTGERELNMGPYGANANSNIYYSLYAISNHMGSTAGGHYVAVCKHPVSKKWHEFNDNLVSDSLSDHHLVSSSAYILFYERA